MTFALSGATVASARGRGGLAWAWPGWHILQHVSNVYREFAPSRRIGVGSVGCRIGCIILMIVFQRAL